MVQLPVSADLRVISRGPVIDDVIPVRQTPLREQCVQRPVEDERVLVVDGDVDRYFEPVNARLLRLCQCAWPLKHRDCQLDEGQPEQRRESAHQQVSSLIGEIKVGSPPYADSRTDHKDEPRRNTGAAETDSGDVVQVGHRSPRPLPRRQKNRIATVSVAVAMPASTIPHVSALSTGDMTHTSRLAELPDLEKVLRVVQLMSAIDQPISARGADRLPDRDLGRGTSWPVGGIIGLNQLVVASFDRGSTGSRASKLAAPDGVPPHALHKAELARVDLGVQVVVNDVR